ncbi:MAG: hypothetical protein PHC64_09585 [Candidatus Gastranaerophilales bacterium]|nr:hypothetical protein [Candidatus Gastranaerophilales bacterium]
MLNLKKLIKKISKKKSGKKIKSVYSNTLSKKAFGSAASLEISSLTKNKKAELEGRVKNILKKYENDPEKLLNFVEKNGTKVYRIPFVQRALANIGYEQGFISSVSGLKALYLNIVIPILSDEKIKWSFSTEPMFILSNSLESCYIIQQFYKWYSMKMNLPGFDAQTQENLQKFLNSQNEEVKDLNLEEVLNLKEAIARDIEAINFIMELAKNTTGAQNAMRKITAGGASV